MLEIVAQINFIIAEYGLEDYDDWGVDVGLTQGVNDGQNDDPDRDGVSNFMEFALGANPLVSNSKAGTVIENGAQANTKDISFKLAQSELHYQIEQSTDITNWTVIWDSRVDLETLVTEGQQQKVNVDSSAAEKMFYRVKVAE